MACVAACLVVNHLGLTIIVSITGCGLSQIMYYCVAGSFVFHRRRNKDEDYIVLTERQGGYCLHV
jgi:hypothetical protein